jgi:glycosyltransferase involved in cell wall biosynthesis
MNIAAFVWGLHPSSNYRAIFPLQELARRGHLVAEYPEQEHLTPSDDELEMILEQFDVAFIGRYLEVPAAVELARRLSEGGIGVVWDYDDDVVRPERRASFDRMIEFVDVVTTTNEQLAERFLEIGARQAIAVPNYLTRFSLAAPRRRHEGTVVGYIGWIDHQEDWDLLGLKDVFEELLDVHPELRVESVGPIDLGLPEDCYHSYGELPFAQLPQAIAGFDIGIAPLMDRPGNAMRSDIKLKEYAIAGAAWLASPYGPYVDFTEEQGGWLVPDGDWFDALDRLVSDGKARKKLSKRAQKWALKQTLERHAPVWLEAFEEAIAIAEERTGARAA